MQQHEYEDLGVKLLDVAAIRAEITTQPRERMDETYAQDLASILQLPKEDPNYRLRVKLEEAYPVVFFDGRNYFLADGFHRLRAHAIASRRKIACQVLKGTQRDAILYSCGANADHPFRRTNEDKRRAVRMLLTDDEWKHWSNRDIAARCAVSDFMVRQWRAELQAVTETVTFTRSGKKITVPAIKSHEGAKSATSSPSAKSSIGDREAASIARRQEEDKTAEQAKLRRTICRAASRLQELDPRDSVLGWTLKKIMNEEMKKAA